MTVLLATESDLEITLLRQNLKEWKDVALRIRDNRQLRAFLRTNKAALRKDIYDLLLPYLSFKAKPYLLLK